MVGLCCKGGDGVHCVNRKEQIVMTGRDWWKSVSFSFARETKRRRRVRPGKISDSFEWIWTESDRKGEDGVRDVLKTIRTPLGCNRQWRKDSAVCREIVRRARIPFEIHHNPTTKADEPQTIYYVRDIFASWNWRITCCVNYPITKARELPCGLWSYEKFPPTRLQRCCCHL